MLTGSVLAAAPQAATADPPAPVTIALSADDQPIPDRPQLAALMRKAARDGISLEEAVARLADGVKPDSEVSEPDITVDDLSFSQLTDLARMAKSDGIGLKEAIDRYGWQDRFTEATLRIRESAPGQVAGVAIRDGGIDGRTGWIGFKGEIPKAAVDVARTIPAAVELVGGKGYSEEELQSEVERAAAALPVGLPKLVSPDVETGVIDIVVEPPKALTQAELQAAYAPRKPQVPGVRFVITQGKLGHTLTDSYARGGGYAREPSGSGGCTMGFNITKNGTHSPSTAGHCAKANCTADAQSCQRMYEGHSVDGGNKTLVNFKLRHLGHYGDFARYGPGFFTATDTFYYDWNSKRYVNTAAASAGIYAGKNVCKFGRVSGASCGVVFGKGLVVGVVHYLVAVNNKRLVDGDSGGPWYWGNEAIGMSHGFVGFTDGVTRDLFSPVHLIPSALNGWQVRLH
ncbi:hypothetical protein [Actinocorallia sp. A-T 12471]|uniref:hypothetical protein n=1 Tax=Actinocorallia sp. A-T 12471 TaxID=3089813 RepID=UPI0029CC6C91|nr:hypothetical protein [Actinocorallia sp. A-T 12471]MDX6741667.1 hypothetical protein [Actinocorallia sp. A-T 12471]